MARFRTDMYEDNPFVIRRPQQQQQQQQPGLGGLSSLMNMMGGEGGGGMLSGIMPGGGGAGAGSAGAGGGSAGGAGGASAGSGMGSAAAAAGPWAALAAVIIGNEMMASKGGHREGKTFGKEHLTDMLTGDVHNQDMEKRWLPKLGIEEDTKLSKGISAFTNVTPFNFGKQWKFMKSLF